MNRTNCDSDFQHGNLIRRESEIFSEYLFLRSMKNYSFTFYLVNRQAKSLVFLILLMLGLQVNAQERWSLKECITYAIKNNLQLHQADLSEQIASQGYQKSKWNLLPGIGAGADVGRNYGRSVDPNTNGIINTSFFNNSYYIGASVDVFRGFMLQNQIRYQKFRKESTKNYRENATDDLAFEVMNAFFNVIYQEEMQKIAEEQKAISKLNVKKMERLVTTGLKAQTELLEVKANFEKDELFCIQSVNNIASAWIRLKKAMNLPPDQQITLAIVDENIITVDEITTDIAELFKEHSQRSPYIRMFENDWKASQKDVNVQKAGFFPSLSLQASYNTGFYETNKDASQRTISFNSQIKNNQSQFVGASLSIPIFSKRAVWFDVRQSKLLSEQAETKLNQSKQNLLYDMEQNYNDLTAAWKELQQSRNQLEADKLSFQAAQKKFDQGMINAIEFYTVKNRLASTTSQVFHSKLTLEIKKRTLDFYKGTRFWE
ncbi:MAG: TolC family protein [Lentimicrobiaceae bacterium]